MSVPIPNDSVEPVPNDSVEPVPSGRTRRWLLRGGAAAAGAAIVAAATPTAALAADGDSVTLGDENESTRNTTITIGAGGGSQEPALSLVNANGPSLFLEPLAADYAAALELGQVANTVLGPVMGVDTLQGLTTTFLVTGEDLADLPTPYPLPKPQRLLDTRTASGRSLVIRTSAGAYDSSFKLNPGAWLDVEIVADAGDVIIPGAYLNVTSTGAARAGYLTVYPPGDFPGISTLNFPGGMTIANGTFVAAGVVLGRYAVRVRAATTPTHVVLDLTGVSLRGRAPEPELAARSSEASRRTKLTSRFRSNLGERLRDLLAR